MTRARHRPTARGAFSLLEVILATAILMGALSVLGQLAHLGYRNAKAARAEMTAQLLCEAKLAELLCGIEPLAEIAETPFLEQPEWLYSALVTPLEQPGLVALQVTVRENLPEERHPREATLVRWIYQQGAGLQASPGADGPLNDPGAADPFRDNYPVRE